MTRHLRVLTVAPALLTVAPALLTIALALALTVPDRSFAQHPPMPSGMSHEEHLALMQKMQKEAQLKERGAVAMGFDQEKVVHHFLLTPEGGTIQVEAQDPSDETNRDAIRAHLQQITAAFADGVFDAPFLTHSQVPPGVRTMQRLKAAVTYTFGETPSGGRVHIATDDPEARAAIHVFLRYQIKEHNTGDPSIVKRVQQLARGRSVNGPTRARHSLLNIDWHGHDRLLRPDLAVAAPLTSERQAGGTATPEGSTRRPGPQGTLAWKNPHCRDSTRGELVTDADL